MTTATMTRTPGLRAAWGEQLRAVWLGTRRELIATGLILGVPMLVATIVAISAGESVSMEPAEGYGWMAAALGALMPLAVWRDEDRFGESQLWIFPVDHARHALVKVSAGWAVLMGLLAGLMLWAVLLVVVSGGGLTGEETRLLITDPEAAGAGTGGLAELAWTAQWWQWLLPFAAGTVGYLLSSALLLGTRRPAWWMAGTVLLIMTWGFVSEEVARLVWANRAFEGAVWYLVFSPLGLDTVMTSGLAGFTTAATAASGDQVVAWRAMPTLGGWLLAVTLWTAVGAVLLWAASLRHRERRATARAGRAPAPHRTREAS